MLQISEARNALVKATEETQRFQHHYIGTEHLLLGVIDEEKGVATRVLNNLKVDVQKVRSAVEFVLGRGGRVVKGDTNTPPGLTPRSHKAIELAVDEARRFNHLYIGTEHLLSGLIREAEGIAANELEKLGVHLDQASIETLRVLREYQEQGSTESEPPVPAQAATLQAEGEVGQHCLRCQAHCPDYFRYCFNCGSQLPSEKEKEETPESS